MKRISIFTFTIIFSICINATSLDEAKAFYNNKEYSKALPSFKELLSKSPKDASLNNWVGMCLYNLDSINEAIPFLQYAETKSIAESSRHLATIAYKQYRFDDAENHIAKYTKALTKAKKELPSEIEVLSTRIINARNMLDRVEHIQIIDSINVDRKKFFEFYKISHECGSLNSRSVLPEGFNAAISTVVFQPESKTQLVWALEDESQAEALVSASVLSDGTWEHPQLLGLSTNDGNSNYPYIMPDGITLYYANDGENSIGGYDIFVSRKDEDEYLQPQNMGMPYNSPYNDYMLVIDEITGIGWWATDRNNIDGKVTIYMFIPNESRINYPSDDVNIINLAKINSIKDSWVENANYDEYLNRLSKIDATESTEIKKSFYLSLPNGNIYTSLNDFKNHEAAEAMKEYLNALDKFQTAEDELATLRSNYSKGNKNISNKIIELENDILSQRNNLINMRNNVIKLECN